MREILSTNNLFVKKIDQIQNKVPEILIAILIKRYAKPFQVQGIENLATTQELITGGKNLIMISNHLSWADFSLEMEALKRSGFGTIEQNTKTIGGRKIERSPVRRFLSIPYRNRNRIISIYSPSTESKNEEEEQKRFPTLWRALGETEEALKNGYHVIIYPEAGRSRTQKLIKADPRIAYYLTELSRPEDTIVLPMGICGTEKVLPIGAKRPHRNQVTVTFNKPVGVAEEIAEAERFYEHITKRKEKIEKVRERIMNNFMYYVADCLPEDYHGEYAKAKT